MCTTVPSTLLAKHDVEKIKTIRPLNTSLNPLQENRQPRAGREGRGETSREQTGRNVYAHMEKKSRTGDFFLFHQKEHDNTIICHTLNPNVGVHGPLVNYECNRDIINKKCRLSDSYYRTPSVHSRYIIILMLLNTRNIIEPKSRIFH